MSKSFKNKNKAFTLLEILLVVGIIALLAGVVIFALNPARQLMGVRDVERKTDIGEINKAMVQFYIDHGFYPASSTLDLNPNDPIEVCNTGDLTAPSGLPCTDLVDLSELVPTYLVAIPVDPSATGTGTGYLVSVNTKNKLYVEAPSTELNGTNGTVAYVGVVPAGYTIPGVGGGSAATYTVTYNGNTNTGGTVPTDSNEYEAGATVTVLGNTGSLTKTSYTFDGWNTAANGSGTNRAAASTFAIGSANVTLYAKWTADAAPTHTITFDANGGTGSMSNQTITEGESANLTTNSFTRSSYTFDGWATSAGGGVAYADGASYTMGGASVTLYAHWVADGGGCDADCLIVQGLQSGLTFYMPMDSDDNDHSTSGYTVTAVGSPSAVAGKVGNAYSLNGSSQSFEGPGVWSDLDGYSEMTVSVWFYASDMSGSYRILWGESDGGSAQAYMHSSGKIQSYLGGANMESATGQFTSGAWYHYLVTYNPNGTSREYLNGVQIATGTGGNLATGSSDLEIGVHFGGQYDFSWKGKLDEFAIWDRVLTTQEISDLYNAGSGRSLIQDPIL